MNSESWNKCVTDLGGEFLQSYEWGEFQKALGKRVERIERESFLAQVIFNSLPAGLNYGYIPRGPVITSTAFEPQELKAELKKLSSKKTVFFEVELGLLGKKEGDHDKFYTNAETKTRQPKKTSLLDLVVDIKSLEKEIHHAHRYNIRLAEKKGVTTRVDTNVASFIFLLKGTASRQGFRNWPEEYYKKLFETLGAAGMVEIWSAYKGKDPIASNFYILFAGRATYLFGASNYKERSLMAPHLLHWRAINSFKERGYNKYDFWGIDSQMWPGVTLFKERFGGEEFTYPGTNYYIIKPGLFVLYKLLKKK